MPTRTSLLLLSLALVACGGDGSAGEGEIETIEVEPSRTSILTTAYDVVAPQRRASSAGVLPESFPESLPLYDPSNLVDFGDGEGGGEFVLLFTPDTETMVRDRMRAELARSGWALTEGDFERGTWRRGSHRVVLEVRDASPGTEIRVEY